MFTRVVSSAARRDVLFTRGDFGSDAIPLEVSLKSD